MLGYFIGTSGVAAEWSACFGNLNRGRLSSWELKLLPATAIGDLAQVLCSYAQGFPHWFMQSQAVPLPKVWGDVRPDARPITILAQTFRLWSKLINQQIQEAFSSRCPEDVTGFLRSRDARNSIYKAQWRFEKARHSGMPLSGVTLDLPTCFNPINRPRVTQLLIVFGVPSHLVSQWKSSFDSLSRFWVRGCISPQISSCTGLLLQHGFGHLRCETPVISFLISSSTWEPMQTTGLGRHPSSRCTFDFAYSPTKFVSCLVYKLITAKHGSGPRLPPLPSNFQTCWPLRTNFVTQAGSQSPRSRRCHAVFWSFACVHYRSPNA